MAIVTLTITVTVYAPYITQPKMLHLDFERWQASEVYTYKGRGMTIGHEFLIATFHDAEIEASKRVRIFSKYEHGSCA